MPNQDECDHVVGLCGMPVKQSHIRTNTEWIDEKFAHCPHCGAKIDWQKIEENLNANNS